MSAISVTFSLHSCSYDAVMTMAEESRKGNV
jgi:hypothetical protein